MNQSHHQPTKTTLTCKQDLDLLDKKIGTFLFWASANASSPHGYQLTLKQSQNPVICQDSPK